MSASVDIRRFRRPCQIWCSELLEKDPEERYRSASGISRDLNHCCREYLGTGAIASFPLGSNDASTRLQIGLQPYGRDREIAMLLAAYEQVEVAPPSVRSFSYMVTPESGRLHS